MSSRISRFEEKKQKKRIFLALAGSLAILVLLAVFGLQILVGFSLSIDRLRGNSPVMQPAAAIILPPALDQLPEATNSADIKLTGKGQADLTLVVYINEKQIRKITVPKDGVFTLDPLTIDEGTNTISSKLTDDKGHTSDLSNIVSIMYIKNKPKLTVTAPADNSDVHGDQNTVTVSGTTDPDNQVTVNDRFVVVRSTGTFDYQYALSDGENTLTILARDQAGNETKEERKVTYQK